MVFNNNGVAWRLLMQQSMETNRKRKNAKPRVESRVNINHDHANSRGYGSVAVGSFVM
jgi:hypothetical protein